MPSTLSGSWFYWTVGIAVGMPVLLLLLTELHNALRRRGNPLVRPVGLLRDYLLPIGVLLLLMTEARQQAGHEIPVQVIATIFGFVVLVLLLSALNVALFQGAPEGSWRKRLPSIFLDVARFALIAVGLAMILSFVWGADVAGLFTALGISSIVLGLALQNSVGQIVSGLLMLFEQPFRLGDWLDTPSARGRVVELNWRAVHIDTGSGLQIIPNSVLAGASFNNQSRPPGPYTITIETTFSPSDPPDGVCALLAQIANDLPERHGDKKVVAVPLGKNNFRTLIPVRSPADAASARATFTRWLWYAARRAEYHLDGADDDFPTPQRKHMALQKIARTLRLAGDEQRELVSAVRIFRYGAQERIQRPGTVPQSMKFVVAGQVQLVAVAEDGSPLTVRTLEEGDFLGQNTLTREPVTAGAVALTEVTVLDVDREIVEDLVAAKPVLVRELGRAIEERRRGLRQVLSAAQD